MKYDEKLVDTEFNIIIGEILKNKRIEKGWSLLELSKKLNCKVSRQTLFHYENGKTKIRIEGNISFSALPHSSKEYWEATHNWELPERNSTYLCLNYFMAGIGSNSCGPALDEKYCTPMEGEGKFVLILK